MKPILTLTAERFRSTFFVFYMMSNLLPLLILIFITLYYIKPALTGNQVAELTPIFTYGLAGMLAVPFFGFFLVNWWIRSLEALTETTKNRAAEFLGDKAPATDGRNEIIALHKHFDGLFGELQGKIEEVKEVSKELLEVKKKVSQLTVTDELTTLYNRRHYDRILREQIKKAAKKKQPLALIMIDVDGFKKYNEKFGHDAGDKLLRNIGLLIRDYASGQGYPFRYGGDEFAVVLPNYSVEASASLAQKISEAASRLAIEGGTRHTSAKASISCGVISYTENYERILTDGDRLLNKTASSGKGKVVLLTPKIKKDSGAHPAT